MSGLEAMNVRPIFGQPPDGSVRTCMGLPEDVPGVTCYPPQPDGGIYGRCREYGEEIEGKVIGAYCCEGLTRISRQVLADTGCDNVGPVSLGVCSYCGNDVCDDVENLCNCEGDCPRTHM
jgi:hypothetical protein